MRDRLRIKDWKEAWSLRLALVERAQLPIFAAPPTLHE
jgi:hypothetical protein